MRSLSPFAFAVKFTRVVVRTVRIRGGALPVMRACWTIVAREGFSGLRRLSARLTATENYDEWIARYDSIDSEKRAALQTQLSALPTRPLISLIVPVFNTPAAHLTEMLDAVLAQIYPDWELCICDDASTAPHVAEILDRYSALDARIKRVKRPVNGHICAASNDALALASGSFIALLDHDDLLPEHALFMVAKALSQHPDARLLYSDEDKLGLDNQRFEPYFKCQWNATLMLGQNMFSHLGVFDTALVRSVGGFRVGLEGSQDHDLVLRCAERIQESQIIHIPHVLYHWRISAQSTAGNVQAKPYVVQASMRAVSEHLERTGRRAEVSLLDPSGSMLKVIPVAPDPQPLVSILIPTRDKPALLKRCLDSLFSLTRYPFYEVIVVDNGSTDAAALALLEEYARHHANLRILRIDEPFNFSALNNQAAEVAKGTVLCLLNNDTEVVEPAWLETLCNFATQADIGAVGAALWYPDDRLQHGGIALAGADVAGHLHHLLYRGDAGYFGRAKLAHEVSAVTAACLVVKKSVFTQAGGMDIQLPIAYNDVDFCLRLQSAGLRNLYVPYANLYHHESASRGDDLSVARFQRLQTEKAFMALRWGKRLHDDRFYNPNLANTDGAYFRLASPPRTGQFD